MHLKSTLGIVSLLATAVFFLGNSSGAGNVQQTDRTGSPLSPGTCVVCHSSGAFEPAIKLEILDGTTPVTAYQPGQTYQLRVTITAGMGEPVGHGFQATALTGAEDQAAGNFTESSNGIRVLSLNDREYIEHTRSNIDSNYFEFFWTAPEAGTGAVRFYAAGTAVNGAAGSGGDGAASLEEPLVLEEATATTVFNRADLQVDWTIYPNPARDFIVVEVNDDLDVDARLQLFDLNGRLLREMAAQRGPNSLINGATNLAGGIYQVRLVSAGKQTTGKVLIR